MKEDRKVSEVVTGYKATDEVNVVATPNGRRRNFLPLIFNLVRQKSPYNNNAVENADLVNTGVVALLDTAKRYDPGRGFYFSTFAYRRVSGAIHDSIEKEHNHRKRIEAVETPEELLSNEVSGDNLDQGQLIRRVMEVIEGWLPDLQATVVVLFYLEERPPEEIAELLQLPQEQIEQLLEDALSNLRQFFRV